MPLTIVGLGAGGKEGLTLGALDAMRGARRLILRTGRHGAADYLREQGIAFDTMDKLYDSAGDFDALLNGVEDTLAEACARHDDVVYAVPGGGGLFDETVRRAHSAMRERGIPVTTVPGPGALDALAAADGGLSRLTAMAASEYGRLAPDPHAPLLILELDSRLLASELKLALLDAYPPDFEVMYFFGGGVTRIPLEALDRQADYDHTSALLLPEAGLSELTRFNGAHLKDVMDILRGADGCPWDKEQTHESLMPYLVEEAYEVADAVRGGDIHALYDELGDVLLQVYFHASIAQSHGEFTLSDITTAIVRKMIERHTHIFGDDKAETAGDVIKNWEINKRREKGIKTLKQALDDIPRSFPPLLRAYKTQQKLKYGSEDDASDRLAAALRGVRCALDAVESAEGGESERLIGELLYACVRLSACVGIRPELALNAETDRIIAQIDEEPVGK